MGARRKPRYTSDCAGKTRWSSEETAQRAVTRIRRENPREMDSLVRPYRCPFGGKKHWHLGHEA